MIRVFLLADNLNTDAGNAGFGLILTIDPPSEFVERKIIVYVKTVVIEDP